MRYNLNTNLVIQSLKDVPFGILVTSTPKSKFLWLHQKGMTELVRATLFVSKKQQTLTTKNEYYSYTFIPSFATSYHSAAMHK
jgi:hypothetical protein